MSGGVTCEPCLCSVTGARDPKCDQVTGQCACRPGHSGHKCDICPGGGVERSRGCRPRTEDRQMADTEAGIWGPGGCERDEECRGPGGRCVRGTCECGVGYLPSSRHVCKEDPGHVSHQTRASACSDGPCGEGGTCEEHDGTYTCYCPPLRSGPRCEQRLDAGNFTAAAFHGDRSRVTLTSLNIAGLGSDIKLQFRTFTRDGLLFQAPGLVRERRMSRTDHLTLEVTDSRVKFSFRVSGSEVSLLSEFPVKLGSWHSLHVQRYRAHAVLKMDNQPPVRGQAASTLSTLNLDKYAYIGSAPGLDTPGLQGCIRDLSIDKTRISLVTSSGPLVTSIEGIRSCDSHPCDLGGCHHEAECVSVWPPDSEVRFLCHCSPEYTGPRCQHRRGPCHPNPCRHGGQCRYDQQTGLSCECPQAYSGKLCHRSEKQK